MSAGWIDVVILLLVAVLVSALTGNAHIGISLKSGDGTNVHHAGVYIRLPFGPLLIWLGIVLLYYFASEALTAQTIGKRVMGLRVVRVDGRPVNTWAVALRTLGRLIDGLPVFYLVGWASLRGPRHPAQRVGDRLAGTTVVSVPDDPTVSVAARV